MTAPAVEAKRSRSGAAGRAARASAPRASALPAGARPMPMPEQLAPELATLVERAPDRKTLDLRDQVRRLPHPRAAETGACACSPATATTGPRKLRHRRSPQCLGSDGWIDGEIVVLDERAPRTSGAAARLRARRRSIRYFVFDLPWCAGHDLRAVRDRGAARRLQRLLERMPRTDPFSRDVDADAADLLPQACRLQLEGIIGKRLGSRYVSGRTRDWVKLKCTLRQEFVIGGYTEPQGSRTGLGALLLGIHDADGRLRYAGSVGTGFDTRTLAELRRRLQRLEPPARRSSSRHGAARALGRTAARRRGLVRRVDARRQGAPSRLPRPAQRQAGAGHRARGRGCSDVASRRRRRHAYASRIPTASSTIHRRNQPGCRRPLPARGIAHPAAPGRASGGAGARAIGRAGPALLPEARRIAALRRARGTAGSARSGTSAADRDRRLHRADLGRADERDRVPHLERHRATHRAAGSHDLRSRSGRGRRLARDDRGGPALPRVPRRPRPLSLPQDERRQGPACPRASAAGRWVGHGEGVRTCGGRAPRRRAAGPPRRAQRCKQPGRSHLRRLPAQRTRRHHGGRVVCTRASGARRVGAVCLGRARKPERRRSLDDRLGARAPRSGNRSLAGWSDARRTLGAARRALARSPPRG